MQMRVIMCSDTPVHSIYSTEAVAFETLSKMRAKNFVDSGCNQSMTFSVYKESHIWWLQEVSWEIELVEEKDRECVCRAADGKCKYPQCKTGGKEKIMELTAKVCGLEQELEFYKGCYNETAEVDQDAFERLSDIVINDILQEDKPKPAPVIVDCPHSWEVGTEHGKKIAQCIHCLKVEIMDLKQLNKEWQKSFVKQTVGGR